MSIPTKPVVPVLLCVILLGGGVAEAQKRGGRKQEPQRFTAEGKIVAVARGMIKMVNAAEQTWVVKIGRGADISVQGAAEPDFLKPGMILQLSASVDKKGRVPDKVAELKIISRREDTVMGAFPRQAAGGFEEAAAAPAPGASATTPFDMVGVLTGERKGKYMLNVGQGVVQFELAEDAKISLDVTDYWLGKEGDKIVVSGNVVSEGPMRTPQGQIDGMGAAQTVAIDLSETLSAPTTKKKGRTRASRRRPRVEKEPAPPRNEEKSADASKKKDAEEKPAKKPAKQEPKKEKKLGFDF